MFFPLQIIQLLLRKMIRCIQLFFLILPANFLGSATQVNYFCWIYVIHLEKTPKQLVLDYFPTCTNISKFRLNIIDGFSSSKIDGAFLYFSLYKPFSEIMRYTTRKGPFHTGRFM